MKRLALALLLSLPIAFIGCAAQNPSLACPAGQTCLTTINNPPTPAAIDQKIATSLADAAAIIQGLEPLVAKYPGLKDPLNKAIGTYTTAKAAGLVYHAAVLNGTSGDPTQLQAQIQDLLTSLTGLRSLYK